MHTTKWENQEQAPPTSRASVYAEDHVYDWHDCLHFAQDPEEKSKACTNADSLSLFIGLTHWIKHMHTIDQNQPVYKNAGDRNRMIFARTFDNDGQGHVLHYDPPDPARAKVYWIHAQKELKIKRQREFSSQQLPSRNVQGEVRIYGVFNYVRQQEDPGTRSRSSSPSRQDKPNWPFRERRMRVRKQTKGSGSRGVTRRSSLKKNSSKSKVSPS